MEQEMKILYTGFAFLTLALGTNTAFAVTINSSLLNDFEDFSVHGWTYGGSSAKADPSILPKVVQEANGNKYLQVTSTGGGTSGRGPGSRMSVINETEWRGNYNSAGVGSVLAKMKNMGDESLYMRAAFTTRTLEEWHFAASDTYLELPADGKWYDLSFAIDAENITAFLGNSGECCFTKWDFDEVMGGVNQFKFHNGKDAHFWGGAKISSVLGIDDISVSSEVSQSIILSAGELAPVPVPAAAWLFMTGLLGVAGISRKRTHI